MPYYLTDDTADLDPRWMVLAGGRVAVADQLFAFWHRMYGESSRHTHDGYLTHHEALTACRGRKQLLELLLTPVLGEPPLVHRRGDTCVVKNCIDASPPWVDGFEYRICGFSKKNPTRAEKARNDAQKRDSEDSRLRRLVYTRDGACCRYCRSGPMPYKGTGNVKDRRRALQYDHVDPDRAAGPDGVNYVVACGRCNEFKGRRTPDEADMVLLPVPTQAQRDAWAARGQRLFDPGDPAADDVEDGNEQPPRQPPEQPPDNQPDKQPAVVGGVVDLVVPTGGLGAVSTGEVRLQVGQLGQGQPANPGSEGSGSGRVGQPPVPLVRPFSAQPARDPSAPDIYHGRSRAPAPEHDLPPPPGGGP
ncbi:hypothetical protein SAMN04489727_1707 [Amycolatopsis tolypomycina]|uniref:HNH endonuclease n=1 Tax=Amycolatopsis tolypomycina TaxID=208445 RepID=A0A1H4JBF0_9PSEU|nr:HNH endonuclease [Amycolatopsis tolypomycina]SEB43375.1 hypothetical protein SAMN04489727_1707 [Amycolatopsis tolypomycina]